MRHVSFPLLQTVKNITRTLVILLSVVSLSGCYLSHLALGQAGVIYSSVPLDQALTNGRLNDSDKAKLWFIQDVKQFSEEQLGLEPSCNFSKYLLRNKEPVVEIVTAVRRKDLEPKTWWYPIVGKISYKGFFDHAMAATERSDLKKSGHDVYVRPAATYSTLGWFCDPVVPTMLNMSEAALASLIIHELTHTTLYVQGDSTFNESLADFVGQEGARQFLESFYGHQSEQVRQLQRSAGENHVVVNFMKALGVRLRALYGTGWSDIEARRETLLTQAKKDLAKLCTQHSLTWSICSPHSELNSAVVLAHVTYGTDDEFKKLFRAVRGDWKLFFATLRKQRYKQ